MPSGRKANLANQKVFRFLQETKKKPDMTQRECSIFLEMTLGKFNFLLDQ